jgi:hypothetical protein
MEKLELAHCGGYNLTYYMQHAIPLLSVRSVAFIFDSALRCIENFNYLFPNLELLRIYGCDQFESFEGIETLNLKSLLFVQQRPGHASAWETLPCSIVRHAGFCGLHIPSVIFQCHGLASLEMHLSAAENPCARQTEMQAFVACVAKLCHALPSLGSLLFYEINEQKCGINTFLFECHPEIVRNFFTRETVPDANIMLTNYLRQLVQ